MLYLSKVLKENHAQCIQELKYARHSCIDNYVLVLSPTQCNTYDDAHQGDNLDLNSLHFLPIELQDQPYVTAEWYLNGADFGVIVGSQYGNLEILSLVESEVLCTLNVLRQPVSRIVPIPQRPSWFLVQTADSHIARLVLNGSQATVEKDLCIADSLLVNEEREELLFLHSSLRIMTYDMKEIGEWPSFLSGSYIACMIRVFQSVSGSSFLDSETLLYLTESSVVGVYSLAKHCVVRQRLLPLKSEWFGNCTLTPRKNLLLIPGLHNSLYTVTIPSLDVLVNIAFPYLDGISTSCSFGLRANVLLIGTMTGAVWRYSFIDDGDFMNGKGSKLEARALCGSALFSGSSSEEEEGGSMAGIEGNGPPSNPPELPSDLSDSPTFEETPP